MDSEWLPTLFETCPGGVSSAVTPPLLPPGQFAWGFNAAVRGGKPHTRPPFIERPCGLPPGLVQGASYFGVQGGMIVVAIAGKYYRVRIGVHTYSSELIPLPWDNSGILKQNWFQQTIETLVIQDGQSNAILYNGSTARRAGLTEVPRGRMMAYGNGRLWVAVNDNELLAGDIRTGTPGSELLFTEGTYLVGGGKLFFARGITGMDFMPVTGAADFGTLIIGGKDYLDSIRADVTTRDQWGMPGFITHVFRDVGYAGDWSIVQVNQDLYWRDAAGGIRSLANNLSTNSTPGSTPISREVARLVDFDSNQLLPFCSAIYFDNRLLMTASPYLNVSGGVSFKDFVALDFSPISTMQGKAPPAYDGQWTGIPGVVQLVTGEFNGKGRAFAIASDEQGVNRLWEILKQGRTDIAISCGSGLIHSPIQSFIEYPAAAFGLRTQRKRLERCDVWVSGVIGELELVAYWRSDNSQKWTEWDRVDTCAKTEDASTTAPHVWKNLLPQQRTQIKTFTIPDGIDEVTKYALQIGFEFQIRLAWRGKCQVEKILIYASPSDDPDYANRETLLTECIENNVTGNRIGYLIPSNTSYLTVTGPASWSPSGTVGGPFSPSSETFTVENLSDAVLEWTVTLSETWMIADVPSGTLQPGQSVDVTISLDADALPAQIDPYTGTILFTNTTSGCLSPAGPVPVDLTVNAIGSILFEGRQLGGTVSLCGFEEFIPGTPPAYYKKRDVTTMSPFLVCVIHLTDCVIPVGPCGGNFSGSFSGLISGIPYVVTGAWSLLYTSETLTHRSYLVTVSGTVQDTPDPNPPSPLSCRLNWTQNAIGHFNFNGDTITVPKADGQVDLAFQFNYVSWQTFPGGGGCVDPGQPVIAVTADTWDQHDNHTLPDCDLIDIDDSQRETGVAFSCGQPFNSSFGPLPASTPVGVYGSGVDVTIDNTTSKTYDGVGCAGAPGSEVQYTGTVSEVLSLQDTDEDAIDRFEAENPFSSYTPAAQVDAGYQERTGISFGYERGQWRASLSDLIPLTGYNFNLDIYRRDYGTGSYVNIGTLSIPFTSDSSGEFVFTDQEVDNPIGSQTYLTNPVISL